MALPAGARLGPYEIQAPLGAGGMGEVYKARDTRLDRTVAIKVLPDSSAQDAEARARFTREARAISSLDHPHICALYDMGEHQGAHFLVMQYLEGQTLAERLAKGALPIDQVLQVGIQIADALDRAHRAEITHRDLKPGNVMLTKSGSGRQGSPQVKLLDFGLAKLRGQAGPVSLSGATRLSDQTPTAEGTILGTLYYMAPEQVEGKDADARSDIFALGTVLYEMTTGRRPFEGASPASVMSAILKDDPPPIAARQPVAPPALEHVIQTCLAKDPDERWQSAADVKRELAWVASTPASTAAAPATTGSNGWSARLRRAAVPAVLLAALALTLPAAWRHWFAAPLESPAVRFDFVTPWLITATGGSVPATQVAVSPDGRRIAFVAGPPGSRGTLWIRPLGASDAQMLPGTEDASYPFWSPDGRFVGFFAQSKLKKIDITGGPPLVLCNASTEPRGATWNRDDVIVFSPRTTASLLRVSATAGAEPTVALDRRQGESSLRWPSFLPDGRHFLYFARAQGGKSGIYVGSIDGESPRPLILGLNYAGLYAPPGYVLAMKDGTLLAYPFDARALKTTGDPARVVDQVGGSSVNMASFSVSATQDNAVLAFAGPLTAPSRLEWFDRAGRPVGSPSEVGDYVSFRLSPDGRQVAFSRVDRQTSTPDIYLLDVARGVETRFTSDPGSDVAPIWSPDGKWIVFRSDRAGGNFAFIRPANASEPERQFGPNMELPFATDWSADGRVLTFHTNSLTGSYDVVTMALSGGASATDAKVAPFVASEFNETGGAFSPDGHWLAYASDASMRAEIYVAPFPRAGGDRRVSVAGGSEPHWRSDGRELYYLAPDGTLMAVDITPGATFESGTPHALFKTRAPFPGWIWRKNYDVTPDGSRFLVTTPVERGAAASAISVLLNWTATIRK